MRMQNKAEDIVVNFEKLAVSSIGSSSGIFIGKNNAIGWSAHGKSNQGLGSVNGNVMHNLNMVFDNDLVDSPIDDRDLIVDSDMYLSAKIEDDARITLDEINVTSLSGNAAISVGKNRQSGWDAHSKANTGIGQHYDDSITCNNLSVIDDADLIDSPINDQDVKASICKR